MGNYGCGSRANTLHHPDLSVSDLIFSSATLQWCSDLDHTFAELKRILKPGD